MILYGRAVSTRGESPAFATRVLLFLVATILAVTTPALADGGVVFTDIAENGGAGITYQRAPNPTRLAVQQAIEATRHHPRGRASFGVRANETPMKPWGAPGVALIDFDRDGDLDIYAPNGPGSRQQPLLEPARRDRQPSTFVDVAVAVGADLTDQESTGVCYGDIDNDGDDDLYVTGVGEPNRLLENQLADTGVATFVDITNASGAGGGNTHSGTCSFGDFNGDGLLDIFVANTYDAWDDAPAPDLRRRDLPLPGAEPALHQPGRQHLPGRQRDLRRRRTWTACPAAPSPGPAPRSTSTRTATSTS